MRLLILYGAPAAGKFTIASEVARRTGFRLFHNHISIDCVRAVFDIGTKPFGRLVQKIRTEVIAEAAKENVDLVFTFVYAAQEDDEIFEKLITAAEDVGGSAHLVLLRCDAEVLKERIGNDSRVRLGKLVDPGSIAGSLSRYDLRSALPGRESLVIDTTETLPETAAGLIISHFGLRLMEENDA